MDACVENLEATKTFVHACLPVPLLACLIPFEFPSLQMLD
jgi:hypothetical protein